MVILTAPYGQKSNRFLQHIHLDSFCRNNGIEFYNKFLLEMLQDYPNLKLHSGKIINYFMKGISNIQLSKLLSYCFDDRTQTEYYKSLILKTKILFCSGWHFRSYETTLKYRSFYQKLFNPAIDKSFIKKVWLHKTNDYEKIIGVHVRRGDYTTFANGIYLYDDNIYINKMQQLASNLNNNCRFIIFSNDNELDVVNFNTRIEKIVVSDNSVVIDHYLMSKCDYIIGPPSTFSMWASYIGETLLYHIEDKNDKITLEKFKVCDG